MSDLSTYKTFIPVASAQAIDNHTIKIGFADGSQGTLDLSGIIGKGPWQKLADAALFSQAHAEFDTVVWPDDIDIAPEYVYDHTIRSC